MFEEVYADVIFDIPIPSMYGIFTFISLIFTVNVGKYAIHGWYGIEIFGGAVFQLNFLFDHKIQDYEEALQDMMENGGFAPGRPWKTWVTKMTADLVMCSG